MKFLLIFIFSNDFMNRYFLKLTKTRLDAWVDKFIEIIISIKKYENTIW